MSPCGQYQSVLVFLIFFLNVATSVIQTETFVKIASGNRLDGHVLSQHRTESVMECAQLCLRKRFSCKSINYKSLNRKNQNSSKNCELNDATKTGQLQNLKVDMEYNYYESFAKPKDKDKQTNQKNGAVNYAKSCDSVYHSGKRTTGVYTIDPDGLGPFQVRCDMTSTPGRGWTIFQRRVDGSENFFREWKDYKNGFGNLSGEFWLGLEKIHRLTESGQNVLRVDLESFEGQKRFARFGTFTVGNENEDYILKISQYTGDAGDSLSLHNGMKFSTKDVDNDLRGDGECANIFKGAWWYQHCHASNLNGQYLAGAHTSYADGVNWHAFKGHHYSLKTTEMKVQST
ncbi:ficolin-2-like [Dendronephthya gigantea]|uniref:ficolin-2-like n=1 Tax=Dendronephthya gigantea TaxID=151771 RepID=UPI00106AE842|nr:ficolin-2-like [Dendronephthya gigantea]